MSIDFSIISLSDLTEQDIANMEKAIASDTMGQSLDVVAKSIRCGETTLWRWRCEEGSGVMMTQEYRGTKEKELFVWYMGGLGLRPHGEFVTAVLEEFCRLRGLCRITAIVKPGVQRYLRRFGYGIDRYLISKEIQDGRRRPAEHDENDSGHPEGVQAGFHVSVQ